MHVLLTENLKPWLFAHIVIFISFLQAISILLIFYYFQQVIHMECSSHDNFTYTINCNYKTSSATNTTLWYCVHAGEFFFTNSSLKFLVHISKLPFNPKIYISLKTMRNILNWRTCNMQIYFLLEQSHQMLDNKTAKNFFNLFS